MGHSTPHHEWRSSHVDRHYDAVVGSVVAAPVAVLEPAIGIERTEPHTDAPVAASPAPLPIGRMVHLPERVSEVGEREQATAVAPRVVVAVPEGVEIVVAGPAGMRVPVVRVPVVVDVVLARVVVPEVVPRVQPHIRQADTQAKAPGSRRQGESAPRVLASRSLGTSRQREAEDQNRSGEPLHVCLLEGADFVSLHGACQSRLPRRCPILRPAPAANPPDVLTHLSPSRDGREPGARTRAQSADVTASLAMQRESAKD